MLTETFVAATEAVNKPVTNLSSTLKDVGIFHYEFQPQNILRHGYKKSSVRSNCLAVSRSHIFAAQADKAVIHVYNREKGNQEATVPLPDKIYSLVYAHEANVLVIGTEDGKLIFWEVITGRITTSAPSHLEAVSSLVVTKNNDLVISGSADSNLQVWSLGQLLSFSSSSGSYNDSGPSNTPLRAFSNHRAGITALAVGNSRTNTNFAVSAASDLTCYLWHIDTCRILRTFLLPVTPLSIELDPADRAIYLGNDDGTIHSIDLYGHVSDSSKRSIYDISSAVPVQLTPQNSWSSPSSDTGAVKCLTLSYDGMSLLSGHTTGMIIRWDVAKHRVVSEIANLNQAVNSIQMLFPDGLNRQEGRYAIPAVVKPRLELNAEVAESSIGIPASYSLAVQVKASINPSELSSDISAVLNGDLFSDTMLSDAIQAMTAKSAGILDSTSATAATSSNKNNTYKIQALEEDKALLQKKLAVIQKLYDDSQERHRARMQRRDAIGLQRREAYFAAKKKGKDGDEAMKPFEKKLEAIDIESDEEELGRTDEMDVDDG